MKTLTTWVRHHSETISLLIVVALGILAGVALGGIFAFLSGFWLVVSGEMSEMVLTSWGY